MLAFTRSVPLLERDLAALSRQKMPLLDALISIFVERLIAEILQRVEFTFNIAGVLCVQLAQSAG